VPHPVPLYGTILTSMFVHGGLFHLAGNMLYLWIFGDNVEDRLGRVRYLLFYLLSGVGAAAAQILSDPHSKIPMVGASGAISGVLGAYLLLYPHARVVTLVFFGWFVRVIEIRALIVLGFWIVVQLVSGLLTWGAQVGGVAWFAHVGGFVAGLVMVIPLRRREAQSAWEGRAL
ncbi:MAG TPA: rhomboid family intramembrane serine protease, partial [Anaerolineales bacterium]|nr:rhomboid family intramembrane serine protease [Anaerolineales bacterium]